ncbi:hypothetical protein AQF98_00045 [Pedobacter sp. Hv1]|nr:hypothetical protein AQF98_00045 [Pedobacter sp. Hv1]
MNNTTKTPPLQQKYLIRISRPVLSLVFLITIFSSCKKSILKEPEIPQTKMIKSIKIVKDQLEQNYIVNYNENKQVSYFGSADFKTGYNYYYMGTKINRIEHHIEGFLYTLILNYSNDILLDAEFKVKTASGTVLSFPLTCTKTGDMTTIATNSNDLTYLKLQVSDGKLMKALTDAFYLKTSINFQYNEQDHRVYGNSIPIYKLKNPFSQDTAALVNELISLSLQSLSQKQLVAFQSLRSSATLSYTHNSGNVVGIKCQSDELDTDGNFVESVQTNITYSYSN